MESLSCLPFSDPFTLESTRWSTRSSVVSCLQRLGVLDVGTSVVVLVSAESRDRCLRQSTLLTPGSPSLLQVLSRRFFLFPRLAWLDARPRTQATQTFINDFISFFTFFTTLTCILPPTQSICHVFQLYPFFRPR